jgi:hypothetical protein
VASADIDYAPARPASAAEPAAAEPAPARRRYLDLSLLRRPEWLLCIAGPVLLATLVLLPWFSTAGTDAINGHHGSVTGWQAYGLLRYFLLWCGVGAFILPWMVARRHDIGWRRGEMTAVHGIIGFGLIFLNGLAFQPGTAAEDTHLKAGYFIGLATMLVYIYAGVRSADRHAPIAATPPGVLGG